MSSKIFSNIEKMPLVAILRGVKPAEAAAISDALVEGGFVFMEVTLNSPSWQKSLEVIKKRHGDHIVLGAGTVLHQMKWMKCRLPVARSLFPLIWIHR